MALVISRLVLYFILVETERGKISLYITDLQV